MKTRCRLLCAVVGGVPGAVDKVVQPEATPQGQLGSAVALDGERAVVGVSHDGVAASYAGAVVVVERRSGSWRIVDELRAADAGVADLFGMSVDLGPDRIVAGAPYDDDTGANAGSAYLFERRDGRWVQACKLTGPCAVGGERFGLATALAGDTWFVAAPFEDGPAVDSGAVHVFVRGGGS